MATEELPKIAFIVHPSRGTYIHDPKTNAAILLEMKIEGLYPVGIKQIENASKGFVRETEQKNISQIFKQAEFLINVDDYLKKNICIF